MALQSLEVLTDPATCQEQGTVGEKSGQLLGAWRGTLSKAAQLRWQGPGQIQVLVELVTGGPHLATESRERDTVANVKKR